MTWHYFAGIDATHGGVGRTRMDKMRTSGDDFAITTVRAKLEGPVEYVSIERATGITALQQSATVHRQHRFFRYTMMVMDPSGGGLSVRDGLRDVVQRTGAEEFEVQPIVTIDDEQLAGVGEPILVLFGRSDSRITGRKNDPSVPGAELVLTSESTLPNKMHEIFRGALEGNPQGVRFPARWKGWPSEAAGFNNPDTMRDWLNAQPGLGRRDKIAAEFDLALFQLACVNRKLEPDMKTPVQDKSGNFSFDSYYQKDAAYSMIYAYFAAWLWRKEQAIFARSTKKRKTFLASAEEV